jgi:hypothetical protein
MLHLVHGIRADVDFHRRGWENRRLAAVDVQAVEVETVHAGTNGGPKQNHRQNVGASAQPREDELRPVPRGGARPSEDGSD